MTILGKITIELSDDLRYVAGKSYDVVLSTPMTPDPATLVQGTIEEPPATVEGEQPAGG